MPADSSVSLSCGPHEAEVARDDLDMELGGDDQPAEEHLEDREGDHAERELHVKKSSPVAQSSLSTEAAISMDETMTKTAIPMRANPHAAVYMRRKMEYAWPTSRQVGMADGLRCELDEFRAHAELRGTPSFAPPRGGEVDPRGEL